MTTYRYRELSLRLKNHWVYETVPGKNLNQRIGTQERRFWEEVERLGKDGWRVVQSSFVQDEQTGGTRTLLWEREENDG